MTGPRIALTPGEPAGCGPDLALLAALQDWPAAITAYADPDLLRRRAALLGLRVDVVAADGVVDAGPHRPGRLPCVPVPLGATETPGRPEAANARYVLDTLRLAAAECLAGRADALVTGPVQKSVINDAGIPFSGHTEFLAEPTIAALAALIEARATPAAA